MAYESLKNSIDAYIRQNGVQAITGDLLNGVLNAMVTALGHGYQYLGVAASSTAAPSGDGAYFFLASAGSYPSFGDITVPDGSIGIISGTGGSWSLETLPGGGSGIPDAPSDGKTYGRKDGAWTEVPGGSSDAVLYTPQELTDEQKEQARTNIAAAPKDTPIQDVQQVIDLYSIIGKDCYAVYRFDDTGYYVLHTGGFSKLSLDFEKIYTVNVTLLVNSPDSKDNARNLCCKINDKIFIAVSYAENIVYMYDEISAVGKYLNNPEKLQYYGSIYLIGNKIYYFHRFNSSQIYVYDEEGNLLDNISNEHDSIRITEGIAFTRDGYKVNLEDFSFEQISIAGAESISALYYAFADGNYIYDNIGITDASNTMSYKFPVLPISNYAFALNKNGAYTRLYSSNGVYMAIYPYNISNSTNRQFMCSDIPGGNNKYSVNVNGISNYDKYVYMVTPKSILIIDNIQKYVTD